MPVRELVDFVLRTGDLGAERDFAGSNRALAGTRGHQQVQRSRPEGYQKEVRLSWDVDTAEFMLRVQGRIDGLLQSGGEVLLEEIKTIQGRWQPEADPLHWAQVQVYGFIYARQQGLERITLRLVYLELESGRLTEFTRQFSQADLVAFFTETIQVYLDWIRERCDWCRQRDHSIRALPFPFQLYRPGQRRIAVATYRAIVGAQRLFLEAPTGIGKTISVLFAAVKSLGQGSVERIFYLTARTTGQTAVAKAWQDLRQAGLQIKTLTLTAKEKVCQQQGQPCDPAACPLARGYFDRRKGAMRSALLQEELDREALHAVAQRHQVCPFELSLDLSTWVDAVTCDYNYAFDPRVRLRRHFADGEASCVLLIDEAHNLVDRAREMFSAEIDSAILKEVRRSIQPPAHSCAKALGKLQTVMRKLCGAEGSNSRPPTEPEPAPGPQTELGFQTSPATPPHEVRGPGAHIWAERALPCELLPSVKKTLADLEKWLIRDEAAAFRPGLLEVYYTLSSFGRVAEGYDASFRTILTGGPRARVKLFCLDPSRLIREALDRAGASVFFSATLAPLEYYRDLLGGCEADPALQVSSPFPPENLGVLLQSRIRTDFKSRAATLPEVAECLGAFVGQRPGNYLVYVPSYDYLTAVIGLFQARFPTIPVLMQRPGMAQEERDRFLAAFATPGAGTQVGFAVMGGIFGEGIDLVGDRLIGAAIVGVGLPQLCLERNLIRDHFEEKVGAGFDYAYRFPGMNRVLQATGRVIRSDSDRGIVLLIDRRFGEARYRVLFPKWWRPVPIRSRLHLNEAVRQFWDAPRPA